jgi:hypothetical protein
MRLQEIMTTLELPLIDAGARKTLQRLVWRREKYEGAGKGRERVILTIRARLPKLGAMLSEFSCERP